MLNFLHNIVPPSTFLEIGPLTIRYYGLFLMLAILASVFLTIKIAKWYNIKQDLILDLSIYLIIGGILGARIYDIFLELPYYLEHPLQMVKLWEGGLAIHGGLIGGFLALLLFVKKNKLSLLTSIALVVPGISLGQAIGRWGNWFNQELFGLPSKLSFAIPIELVYRPINYIDEKYFEPTFLYESLACFLLALILFLMHRHWRRKMTKKRKTLIIVIYLLAYAFIRFMLEFIKIDYTPTYFTLRWPQIASLIMMFLAIFILVNSKQKKVNTNL